MLRKLAPLAFVVTTVLAVLAVVVAAVVLPERVPTHFAANGQADDWSSRTAAVTVLALITTGVAGLFGAVAQAGPKMSTEWMNVPHKQQWLDAGPEEEMRRRVRADAFVFGASTDVVVLSMTIAITQAARSGTDALPGWWFVVAASWVLFRIAHVVLMHRVRYRLERVVG
ncbi:DUF1648 domain-containing protein [Kineococcus auxinigenes]|uniref:DUF1648 domain-containing protein n=1 Tax=unclassified Kineococcus TaxID=2621656 RepID=UPI003D7C3D98